MLALIIHIYNIIQHKFKSIAIYCAILFFVNTLFSQNFIPVKKVTEGITLAIEINSKGDLDYVKKNLNKFYGVQYVRINGDINIQDAAKTIELLDDVQDVQLIKFSGEIDDAVIEKMEWVNNVTFYLKNGREDDVVLQPKLDNLQGLTLIYEIAPEDFNFLSDWKRLSKLTILAPFVKKEALTAINAVSKLKQIKHFGISLDKIVDLPKSITQFGNLQSLSIIDNLSLINLKYIENIPVTHKKINYKKNNSDVSIDFYYYAEDVELLEYEKKHLSEIYTAFYLSIPIASEEFTSTEAQFGEFIAIKKSVIPQSNTNKIIEEIKDGEFVFETNCNSNKVFYIGKSAAVLIPKNCFSMKQNDTNTYNGNYFLKVKILQTPAQFFCNNYNIFYDSNGVKYAMNPGLLLDISATTNGKNLYVKPGYFIKMQSIINADTALKFYAYNNSSKKWLNAYNYDYDFDDVNIVPIDFYNFYAGKKTAEEIYGTDKKILDERFENQEYYYLLEPGVNKVALASVGGQYFAPTESKEIGTYINLRRGSKLVGLRKEFLDKRIDEGLIRFTLFDKSNAFFPEIKTFEKFPLEISGNNAKDFSLQFIRGAVYSDVRIEQLGAEFYLELKTEAGYWKIKLLQPKDKKGNAKKIKLAQAEFLKHINKYFAARELKNRQYTNYIKQQSESNILNSKRALFLAAIKPKGMVSKEIKIRSTGVFILARPVAILDTFSVVIKPTNSEGILLDVKQFFVAHIKPYTYTTFYNSESYNISIDGNKFLYMACIDSKGKVYYINATDFKNKGILNNSVLFLPFVEMPRPIRSLQDLERLLQIKNK